MTCQYIKFKRFISSTQYGYTANKTMEDTGEIKYLRITDIVSYFVNKETVPYCEIEEEKVAQYLVKENDLLIARTGATTGYNLLVDTTFKGFVFASYLIRFNYDQEKLYPQYVKYVLKSQQWYGFVGNYIGGSAQPGMNAKVFGNFSFPYFKYDHQHRIASILSAYDELIEKNNRKIAILQEQAQDLYKEWFVRFRFPGHETAKFENGLPEGWKLYRFSEKVDIMSGGTPNTDNDNFYGENIPFYTPKDSTDSIFSFETITNITQEGLEHCNSQLYPKSTVMVTARGTVGKTNILAVPMAMNQSCYALKLKDNESPYFLYFSLCEEIKKLKCVASGGVFDTIIVKTFDTIRITMPTLEYLKKYNKRIEPIMESIRLIETNNRNLTQQRDLLLPRLMSGKLEVH